MLTIRCINTKVSFVQKLEYMKIMIFYLKCILQSSINMLQDDLYLLFILLNTRALSFAIELYRNYNYLEDATEKDVETQYAFRLWMPYFLSFVTNICLSLCHILH